MVKVRKNRVRSLVLMLAALSAVPLVGRAENDADRVPADAEMYLHWTGQEALGGAYANSNMKGLMDALKIKQVLMEQMSKHLEKLGDAQKKEQMQSGVEILQTLCEYPTSVYVGTLDLSNPDKPMPTIALFSKVGAGKAGEFSDKLNALIPPDAKDKGMPLTISAVGEYLLVNIGADSDMTKRLSSIPPTDGLGSSEGFNKTMSQFGAGAAESPALIYLNGEGMLHLLDDFIAAKGGAMGQKWSVVESGLGLTEIKQIAWAGNFDGPNWTGQAFVGMGAQRTGLLDFLDNKAMSDDAPKLIPSNATWGGVLRFDGTRFLDDIRNAAGQIDPRGQQQFDFGMRQFFAFTGVDLKNDLLASVGDEAVYYAFPDENGKSFTNLVVSARLKNAQKAETAFSTLENTINALITQRDANSGVSFKTEPLDAPNEKVNVHVLTLPMAAPAWAINGDLFYFGISKSAVQHAIDNAGKNGTILNNATFAELRKKLGVEQMAAFDFVDIPKVAPEEYEIVKKLIAELHVPYELPPLGELTSHLTPYLMAAWTDAAGFHAKSTGPFPFSGNVMSPYQMNMQKLQGEIREGRKAQAEAATQPAMP